MRYTLEGYETTWHEGAGQMGLTVRYADERGDQIAQTTFEASGESAGWNGTLTNSTLSHRRETLVAPPHATRVWLTISSGVGPPGTVGIYVIADLSLSRIDSSNAATPAVLLQPLFEPNSTNLAPAQWVRDGIQPSMARVLELGKEPKLSAFAILDEDPLSHAEWHDRRETAPTVAPGDRLVLEWNELFSIGLGDTRSATYPKLSPGQFRFRVQELTALGTPTGIEDSLNIRVPVPLWESPLFWPAVLTVVIAASFGANRYVGWYQMRREVTGLKHQRALEQERLRIAQDIHDDLGARVTQISLLSAMAQGDASLPPKARTDFGRISQMTRELVSALYETVWTVNPENDNLDALGNYLCQTVNELCAQAGLRCRLNLVDLPLDVQVSSQTRHHIAMAVKEAVHNVIKHAKAEEVRLRVSLDQRRLTISIEDDGRGFEPGVGPVGSGLKNIQRRLVELGGDCSIQSHIGRGTKVEINLLIDLPE
ncbi:MAG TPA: sensor histidine kinase [Patescibacteria group bacterium]|nr:sensor histidine kinase [Patescibacteria group bacterium]